MSDAHTLSSNQLLMYVNEDQFHKQSKNIRKNTGYTGHFAAMQQDTGGENLT